ncbi:SPX domain-containing protein 4 [Eucalyptus grandis]|uniref:SPX domain-containing protein 4 n=1 Tax=Eucalyptus grandis TaxID=71139 RepID=UPI00192EC425|nr:SPX domain-containing protein 4 [Eucalyptus grandis]
MKFGKEFTTHLEETLPEWRDKFLSYKPLKKLLKRFPSSAAADSLPPRPGRDPNGALQPGAGPLVDSQEWFVRILNEELDKFNDFYVDKEEEFVIRFQELKERIERVKEKSSRAGTSTSEFSEQMMEIRKDFVTIHGEMVLLKNYSSLNFAGLVKILKKYDKRTGGVLRLPYTQLALHQPFFTTESLTGLVRECEENLELLFPLEAEVIESSPATGSPSNQQTNDTADVLTEPSSTLGEEATDIYRSTLAAMRTIQGLKRASSTYNPLSFSSFFRHDDESNGAVTSEDSASNSPCTVQKGEDTDGEDADGSL